MGGPETAAHPLPMGHDGPILATFEASPAEGFDDPADHFDPSRLETGLDDDDPTSEKGRVSEPT